MNDSIDYGRFGRFASSAGLIALPLVFVWQTASAQGVSLFLALIGPLVYLMAASILIAAITGRLYAQHEIRQLKFDTLVIILATCLVALPLALSNVLWDVYDLKNLPEMKDSKMMFTGLISAVAVFMLLPILMATEALIFWTKRFWFRPRQSDGHAG